MKENLEEKPFLLGDRKKILTTRKKLNMLKSTIPSMIIICNKYVRKSTSRE